MTAPDKPGLSNEELKPCPFCGSKCVRQVSVAQKYERDEYFRIVCDGCKAYGPAIAKRYPPESYPGQKQEAIKAWNRRAQSPPVAQVEVYRKALDFPPLEAE